MNRLYEGLFLFDSNLASRDWNVVEKFVEEMLRRHEAEVVYSERWPDRKLAYEIKGCKKGTYYLTYFNAPPTAITAIRRDCELSDRVLRALFVRDEGIEEMLARRRARQERGEPPEGSEAPDDDDRSRRSRGSYGDRSYGDRSYGDRSYGDRSYGDRSYRDRESHEPSGGRSSRSDDASRDEVDGDGDSR